MAAPINPNRKHQGLPPSKNRSAYSKAWRALKKAGKTAKANGMRAYHTNAKSLDPDCAKHAPTFGKYLNWMTCDSTGGMTPRHQGVI
jgi:hypothetical protein